MPTMKKGSHNRLQMLKEFYDAPDEALFSQKVIAAVLDLAETTLEADRARGFKIPFCKVSHFARYKKADILNYINNCTVNKKTVKTFDEIENLQNIKNEPTF